MPKMRRKIDSAVKYIVDDILRSGDITFPGIAAILKQRGIPHKGDMVLEAFPNCVLWCNMSQEFSDVVVAIQRDYNDTIIWDTCHWLVYAADRGSVLALPIAKSRPRDIERGYAQLRWLPVIFRPRRPGE